MNGEPYGHIANMGFTHLTVNHSINFVDLVTGACTQSIETLPIQEPTKELAHRIVKSHNLPSHAFKRLCTELSHFKSRIEIEEQDQLADGLIDSFAENVDEIVEHCESLYEKKLRKYSKIEPLTNESIFSEVYHALIHSHFITFLLRLEHEYAIVLSSFLKQRDDNINRVEQQCRLEMEEAVKNIGLTFTDNQVNQLAKKHIEITEMESSRWSSALLALKDRQRREYRDEVMKMHELLLIEQSSDKSSSAAAVVADGTRGSTCYQSFFVQPSSSSTSSSSDVMTGKDRVSNRREDCFTVNLGAQMKTSHNLRLVSCDVLDLCRLQLSDAFTGHRLQTAISLYSNKLCGLVLLVDNRLNSHSGLKKAFSNVCQQTTDFHFPDLSEQLENVRSCMHGPHNAAVHGLSENASSPSPSSSRLNVGDLYISRHSNLSEVHVVFHVVADDSLHAEVTSRHPVILAYRNVIKTAFNNDIKTITLPLLLVHEMTEEMTIAWCLRRAELVFKCIKGFIMEMSVCHIEESFNIQFLIPETLSDEVFNNFSTMMPSIFRMSNPVVATS